MVRPACRKHVVEPGGANTREGKDYEEGERSHPVPFAPISRNLKIKFSSVSDIQN